MNIITLVHACTLILHMHCNIYTNSLIELIPWKTEISQFVRGQVIGLFKAENHNGRLFQQLETFLEALWVS